MCFPLAVGDLFFFLILVFLLFCCFATIFFMGHIGQVCYLLYAGCTLTAC